MKALTLYQPYAQLIADGRKPYETRSWPASWDVIGTRIAIHAGKQWTRVEQRQAQEFGYNPVDMGNVGLGVVVCTARLCATHHIVRKLEGAARSGVLSRCAVADPDYSQATELFPTDEYGDYYPERWAWRFIEIEIVTPLPTRGAQGFWELEVEL